MNNLVLVDLENNIIGSEDKLVVHEQGLLHRAFSIIVYNDKRELLLQRRALNKYHTPNLWTNTCCSHPYVNESYDEAINRRLYQEMGLNCKLFESFNFIYKSILDGGMIEHEHDTVFIGQSKKLPKLNPSEASDYMYLNVKDLVAYIESNPEIFTPWFKIIVKKLDYDFFSFKNFYMYA